MNKIIKLNLGCGDNSLEGFVNLDKVNGWIFQNGLPQCENGSVDAITISHALMFLESFELDKFIKEAFRVLKKGGIIRITEDNTENPLSDTYKTGFKNRRGEWEARCLTGPNMMKAILSNAGFCPCVLKRDETKYIDNSLIQHYHSDNNPERVFYIEGIKI